MPSPNAIQGVYKDRKKRKLSSPAHLAHEEASGERWLLTYADMITLLLVLFIVLYAISSINQSKYREFKQSVTQAMKTRIPHGQTTTTLPKKVSTSKTLQQQNLLKQIEAKLTAKLQQQNLLKDVTFSLNAAGLTEGLVADSTFFGTDSANLSGVGKEVVDTSASVLSKYPNALEVNGYTDNAPIIAGPYPNNWALSAARATAVVVRMTKTDGIVPSRVVLIGYGQYHPLASNATPVGQSKNRRVNIVISPSTNFTP